MFYENGIKISLRVENSVKRKIANYELFLLSLQCFQKTYVLQTCKSKGFFGKGLTCKVLKCACSSESVSICICMCQV